MRINTCYQEKSAQRYAILKQVAEHISAGEQLKIEDDTCFDRIISGIKHMHEDVLFDVRNLPNHDDLCSIYLSCSNVFSDITKYDSNCAQFILKLFGLFSDSRNAACHASFPEERWLACMKGFIDVLNRDDEVLSPSLLNAWLVSFSKILHRFDEHECPAKIVLDEISKVQAVKICNALSSSSMFVQQTACICLVRLFIVFYKCLNSCEEKRNKKLEVILEIMLDRCSLGDVVKILTKLLERNHKTACAIIAIYFNAENGKFFEQENVKNFLMAECANGSSAAAALVCSCFGSDSTKSIHDVITSQTLSALISTFFVNNPTKASGYSMLVSAALARWSNFLDDHFQMLILPFDVLKIDETTCNIDSRQSVLQQIVGHRSNMTAVFCNCIQSLSQLWELLQPNQHLLILERFAVVLDTCFQLNYLPKNFSTVPELCENGKVAVAILQCVSGLAKKLERAFCWQCHTTCLPLVVHEILQKKLHSHQILKHCFAFETYKVTSCCQRHRSVCAADSVRMLSDAFQESVNDVRWEIRDESLDALSCFLDAAANRNISEVCESVNDFSSSIIASILLRSNDNMSFVRASAMKLARSWVCLTIGSWNDVGYVFSNNKHSPDEHQNLMKIHHATLKVIKDDVDTIVRRSALLTLTSVLKALPHSDLNKVMEELTSIGNANLPLNPCEIASSIDEDDFTHHLAKLAASCIYYVAMQELDPEVKRNCLDTLTVLLDRFCGISDNITELVMALAADHDSIVSEGALKLLGRLGAVKEPFTQSTPFDAAMMDLDSLLDDVLFRMTSQYTQLQSHHGNGGCNGDVINGDTGDEHERPLQLDCY